MPIFSSSITPLLSANIVSQNSTQPSCLHSLRADHSEIIDRLKKRM